MKNIWKTPEAWCTGLISVCFLLTSTGWLSWEYNLVRQIPAGWSDFCTMVAGYLLQAAGIGLHAVLLRKRPESAGRLLTSALVLHMVCMFPAVLSPYPAGTLTFGLLMNVFCGLIAGAYLFELAVCAGEARKALVFSLGYGSAILFSWLLSLVGGGSVYYSEKILVICLLLTTLTILANHAHRSGDRTAGGSEERNFDGRGRTSRGNQRFLALAGLLILLFSIVNSSGFAFPAADVGRTVNTELSRLVYALGLVIAGFVTDRSRKYGAICALTALVIPFIILSLKGGSFSAVVFWALSYFTFGFYSVFRVILFSDIAAGTQTTAGNPAAHAGSRAPEDPETAAGHTVSARPGNLPAQGKSALFFAGFGLMIGRVGDAVGEGICLLFSEHLAVMVALTAVLFAGAVMVFFAVYQTLYVPAAVRQQTEKERFASFSSDHDLSPREQDLLHLILEKKTVAEIAAALSISENTVKYHVRNILQKTGCRSRKDLISDYTNR